MSLQDEHLRQALRHAPDRDAMPNEQTRSMVLEYAKNVAPEKASINTRWIKSGLNTLWQSVSRWPLAGLSSAMAVLLVMVIFWDKHPQKATFDDIAARQVAQTERNDVQKNSAPTKKSEELPAPIGESAPAAAPVAPRTVVADVVPEESKKTIVATAEPPRVADKHEPARAEASSAEVAENSGVVNSAALPESPKPQSNDVLAEREDGLKKSTRAKAAAAPPMVKDDIAEAHSRGAANAAKDIKAGIFRILTLAKPATYETVDEATGYRIEVISNRPATEDLQAELDAYNQAMLDWHAK